MVNVSAMRKIQKLEAPKKTSLAAVHTAMARLASGGPALPMPTTLSKAARVVSKPSLLSSILPAIASIPKPSTLTAAVAAAVVSVPMIASTLDKKEVKPTVSESEEKPSVMEAIVPALAPVVVQEAPPTSTLSVPASRQVAVEPQSQAMVVASHNSIFEWLSNLLSSIFGK
jgi:hypothetical protein